MSIYRELLIGLIPPVPQQYLSGGVRGCITNALAGDLTIQQSIPTIDAVDQTPLNADVIDLDEGGNHAEDLSFNLGENLTCPHFYNFTPIGLAYLIE